MDNKQGSNNTTLWLVAVVSGIAAVVMFILAARMFPYASCFLMALLGVFALLITAFCIWAARSDDKARETFEQLPEEERKRIEEVELRAKQKEEEERLSKLPACPVCGRKDTVKRISTMNRSVSVAAAGLASSKIGKQYECSNCKHKW